LFAELQWSAFAAPNFNKCHGSIDVSLEMPFVDRLSPWKIQYPQRERAPDPSGAFVPVQREQSELEFLLQRQIEEMTIDELRSMYPGLYREIFNRGVKAEREKVLTADLIANASPDEIHPAVFNLGYNQRALQAKRERSVRSSWVISP